MERRDIRQVTELLQKYLKRFQLAPSMTEEEVSHWFLPQDNIIDTYVVEVAGVDLNTQGWRDPLMKGFIVCVVLLSAQGAGGLLTDFASFYTLPSTVMHHPLHRNLKAAYSFYNVHTQTPLLDLMNDALILAKLVISSCQGARSALIVVKVHGGSVCFSTERIRCFQCLGSHGK